MTAIRYPRGSDRFVAVIVTTADVDADPAKVAVTTDEQPPPSSDDPAWTDPVPGTVEGTSRVGVRTAGLAERVRHHVWALPDDADEYAPTEAGTIYMS